MSTFYTACIRSVLTYAAPAFFHALPKYLKDELVRVEKWAMSIICPGLPYQETIELVNIVPVVDFITGLCSNTFDATINDPEHRLNRLIQFSGPSRYVLRCNRRFIVPKCMTDRFRNSFIIRSRIDNIYTQIFSLFIISFILLYLLYLVLYTHFISSIVCKAFGLQCIGY